MTLPSMRASPQVGLSSVARILMVVVFPAPLGPMKPKHAPCSIVRFRLFRATSSPYVLVRLIVSIMGMSGGFRVLYSEVRAKDFPESRVLRTIRNSQRAGAEKGRPPEPRLNSVPRKRSARLDFR